MKYLFFVLGVVFSFLSSFAMASQLIDGKVESLLLDSTSVDEFLKKLENNTETQQYLRNFVPIWSSASLQKSFHGCPRILMRNKDASLSLSFTDCDESTRGSNDIEIVQWNEKDLRFELFSVHYKTGNKVKPSSLGSKNPKACMRCHTGGIGIGIVDPFYFPKANFGWWSKPFSKFLKRTLEPGMPSLGRYKHLFFEESFKPYLEFYKEGEATVVPYRLSYEAVESPISVYNNLLAEKNNTRNIYTIAGMTNAVSETQGKLPSYQNLKHALLSALSNCVNYTKLMPVRADGLLGVSEAQYKLYSKFSGNSQEYIKAVELHQIIADRVNDTRNLKDQFYWGNGIGESFYYETQLHAVTNLYYVYWYYANNLDSLRSSEDENEGVELATAEINLNPIKMSWSPAWSAAGIVEKFMSMESDFEDLSEVNGRSTVDLLRILNGLAPKTGDYQGFWESFNQLSNQERALFLQRALLHDKGLLQERNVIAQDFKNYCESIERLRD